MKRILLMAAGLAVALSLVACGGGGGGSEPGSPTAPPIGTTPPVTETPVPVPTPTPATPEQVVTAAIAVPAIGASGTPAEAVVARAMRAQAAEPDPNVIVYNGVDPLAATNTFFDWAERVLPEFFPGHETTRVHPTLACVRFRWYGALDSYVLSTIHVDRDCPGLGLIEGAAYVLGAPFGGRLVYVGVMSRFVTFGTPTLRYTDKVYALWDGGYPFLATKTGVTRAVNKTSFSGSAPFFNCALPQAGKKQADGTVLIECAAVADARRYVLQLNPATNELSNYTGTVPTDVTFTSSESNSTQPVANTTSCRVADGWYYADPFAAWRLLFKSDADVTSVVKEGTFAENGTVKLLRCYSN